FSIQTPQITFLETDPDTGDPLPGLLEIGKNGSFALSTPSVDATQTVHFDDKTGILTIGTLDGFQGVIDTFIKGDDIIIQGESVATVAFDAGTDVLTLFDGGGGTIGTLQFGDPTSLQIKNLVPDGVGGIGTAPPSFVAGTRIGTERGEVRVEDLCVGDRVQVVGGAAQPVVWLGHRRVDCIRHPEPR